MKIIVRKCDKLKEKNDYNFKGFEEVFAGIKDKAILILANYHDRYVDMSVSRRGGPSIHCVEIAICKMYDTIKKEYIEEFDSSEHIEFLTETIEIIPENEFEKEILWGDDYETRAKYQSVFMFLHPDLTNIETDESIEVTYE